MIIAEGNKITITIDNNEVDEYLNMYFKKYPRRKVKPIGSPIPPTLNQWGNMNRHAKNNLKTNWDTFMGWVIKKYKFEDINIEKAKVTVEYYFKTKHRRDLDNFSVKNFFDGMVDAGVFVDDNCEVINPLKYKFGGYDKDNDRMIITIERLDLD